MSATTNQAQFSNTIADWAKQLHINAGKLQKKVAFDLHKELLGRTPVDTGRLRGNWHCEVGAPEVKLDVNKTEPDPFPQNVEITGEQDVFLLNNVEYCAFVNDGTEKMAPRGFRESSMQAVTADIQKALDDQ